MHFCQTNHTAVARNFLLSMLELFNMSHWLGESLLSSATVQIGGHGPEFESWSHWISQDRDMNHGPC